MRKTFTHVAAAVFAVWHIAAFAQVPAEQDSPVQFDVALGLERDSNVAVLELDSNADASDTATRVDFGVGYDRPSKDSSFDVLAGYNFSQSLHDDYSEFDVRIHRASSTLSYDLGRTDIGANLQYALAELDGDEFLTLTQVSPYVSQLVGRKLFLRFAYARSEKDFPSSPGRDATADELSADAYVFLNGLTSYLVFGYRYDEEAARDAQFDYSGPRLNLQLSQRFAAGERELTFKAYLRFESRDYDNVTPTIGVPRRDDRKQFEATLDIPLNMRWTTTVGYKHADNGSNLPSVDFAENVWSVSFGAKL
jgi:hypothetical protein